LTMSVMDESNTPFTPDFTNRLLKMPRSKTNIRLFVKDDLTPGRAVVLPKSQAHYLNDVMRTRPGKMTAVFNGRDGEWSARIESMDKNGCVLVISGQTRPQNTGPDLWLVFAPLKKTRIDFLVEKATELGVSRLLPVFTRHTAATRINTKRLGATVIEAAEQCERLSVPRIDEPLLLDKLLSQWPADRPLLAAVETGEGLPMFEVLSKTTTGRSVGILTGPEGGFAESELAALEKLSFVTKISLGPRLLRAETAALSALACWQAVIGDWSERPYQRNAH